MVVESVHVALEDVKSVYLFLSTRTSGVAFVSPVAFAGVRYNSMVKVVVLGTPVTSCVP